MNQPEFPVVLPRDVGIFTQPRWLIGDTPAWTGHIPFAFWVVSAARPGTVVELGTHFGNSFFALCQMADALDLDCSAYAVDTWVGDEHSGAYGEDVFTRVSEHNDRHYGRFASLVRSTFDDAVEHFSDGEIDLLHIDGHHTYDSVKHDFESWLPKLSDRGIVLFHDVAVRERNFGVYRLWQEIEAAHATFAFDHSHGLGVAGIGAHQSASVAALLGSTGETAAAVRRVFGSLGGSVRKRADEEQAAEAQRAIFKSEFDALRDTLASEAAAEREALRVDYEAREQSVVDEYDRRIAALELEARLAYDRAASAFDARLTGGSPS